MIDGGLLARVCKRPPRHPLVRRGSGVEADSALVSGSADGSSRFVHPVEEMLQQLEPNTSTTPGGSPDSFRLRPPSRSTELATERAATSVAGTPAGILVGVRTAPDRTGERGPGAAGRQFNGPKRTTDRRGTEPVALTTPR